MPRGVGQLLYPPIMENYFSIGRFVAVFGIKGGITLRHSLGKKTALEGVSALFVEENRNSFLPYFIREAKARNREETLVTLEGIDSPESAKKLLRKNVFLAPADVERLSAGNAPISLLGYTVSDRQHGPLGEVLEIIEMPEQILAKTLYREKELLLPLNESTILRIDREKKQVLLSLPDGLIEVYL